MRYSIGLSIALLLGCDGGDDDPAPTPTGCDACTEEQVCVSHLGSGALYDLCDEGWLGVGCSDTLAPVIVSCNE